MSNTTQRDLIPFFNTRWKYGVTDNDHGTNAIAPLNLSVWDLGDKVASSCTKPAPRQCGAPQLP
jgi:hypothetical protein